MQEVNLEIIRGDDFSLTVQFKTNDIADDITGWTNPKAQIRDLDGNAVAEFTFTAVTPLSGVATISLSDAITATLEVGAYLWDFQRTSGTNIKTRMGGYVNVTADVSVLV